jgi:hypothetical protein
MHLLRYVVKYTVTDLPINTQRRCLKCPPSAWVHFLTRVTTELVTLQSTAALLMFLQRLEFDGIVLLSSSSCVDLVG